MYLQIIALVNVNWVSSISSKNYLIGFSSNHAYFRWSATLADIQHLAIQMKAREKLSKIFESQNNVRFLTFFYE